MEFYKFIQEQQINNFDNLKLILENSPFNLKIKDDINFPNLFLIHNQENSDFSLKLVKECNGIIVEKDTFKIVCYTFNKCSDNTSFDETLDLDNLYSEVALEGTLVRLFYYNNKWNLSTKKCIDASKSKWISNKNFLELFNECLNGYNIESYLHQQYCYSFILAHPENNIVINYQACTLFHISTRDMTSLVEVDQFIGINKTDKKKVDKTDLPVIFGQILNDSNLLYEGCIFIDHNYNRYKVRTPHFLKVRSLWGNTNNRFFRYLELRKDLNMLNEYLSYYPRDRDIFMIYEGKVSELANDILLYYMGKHVHKNITVVPFYFAKIIYKLHGDFFKLKVRTDYNKVMLLLYELEAKKVCFMVNHNDKSKEIKNIFDLGQGYAMPGQMPVPV